MIRASALLLATLLPGVPALAETPLSAAEFEAYTIGKTLIFYRNGQFHGIEEYRDGRTVRWSLLDGECKSGHWYAVGEQICFEYDGGSHQCWRFYRSPTGLRAEFRFDSGTELYKTRTSDEPMVCLGPETGV
ncbi:hypothetical protein LX81_01928 [Palleronia aestuarii]|uniref:MORN repeat protein n=1 Tax=Palleronia aestuarii TaxID=568105 RepID=A0A2W7N8Z2_9RHOB|nr:hypothetical protein [Palleronia aestuarii]PZX16558.1 hypothetical protein LX81_01928 [Palleronia aestuarii]